MAKDEVKDEKNSESAPEKIETQKVAKEDPKVANAVPSPANKSTAYSGKNSVLKWVIIYIVIGAVIYGAWYYFSVAGDTSASDSQTNSLYP